MMEERTHLSRELSEEELPHDATEDLEEAQTVDRAPALEGRRNGGSEEKAGIEEEPGKPPEPEERLPVDPPPLRSGS
jgi:hypothetical protein